MEPVALGTKVPNYLERLSTVLKIQGQQQGLRGQAAEVRSTEQSQRQREGLSNYFNTNPLKHIGPDGLPDVEGMLADPELRAAAGDQLLPVIQAAAATKQAQIGNIQALTNLRGDQREAFAGLMNSLRGDKDVAEDTDVGRQKVTRELIKYGEMHGPAAYPVLKAYSEQLQEAPKGQLANELKIIGMQGMAAAQQMGAQQPQYLNTGSQQRQISPNALPSAPTTIANTIAPGQQDQLGMDQLGNPFRTIRDPRGNIVATPGVGGGGPATFAPGERPTIEAQAQSNFENVSANRKAASMAPQQLDQINKALKLSRETATGSFAAKRADIESALGSLLPSGFQGLDDASKLNELEKLTERIATDASTVLGVNARTDAERESIRKQNANIGYTPQAIQNVLQYAKAQSIAMQAKGDAQEAWLKKEGNGITRQHEFETEFRQAYDPRVFQLAVLPADKRAEARQKMSKEESDQIRQSAKKLIELGVHISAQ